MFYVNVAHSTADFSRARRSRRSMCQSHGASGEPPKATGQVAAATAPQSEESAMLSCRFIVNCEDFFTRPFGDHVKTGDYPLNTRNDAKEMATRPDLPPLALFGVFRGLNPLLVFHPRLSASSAVKTSVAAELRWVIRG